MLATVGVQEHEATPAESNAPVVHSVLPLEVKVTVPEAPALTVAVSVSVCPRLKFVEVVAKETPCVAFPTLIVFDPVAFRLV